VPLAGCHEWSCGAGYDGGCAGYDGGCAGYDGGCAGYDGGGAGYEDWGGYDGAGDAGRYGAAGTPLPSGLFGGKDIFFSWHNAGQQVEGVSRS
jgi:hypothetical protein